MRLIANSSYAETQLDLKQGTSFNFEHSSPLFKSSLEAEAYSYPVELPNTLINRQFFKHLHIAESRAKFIETACSLQEADDILRGRLWVLKADHNSFMVSILKNAWDADILEKSIRVLDYEGIRQVGDMITHANWTVTKNVHQADYVFFPIYNPDFYDYESDYGKVVNRWDVDTQSFVINQSFEFSSDRTPYQPYYNTLVPSVYLLYVLKRIAHTFGKRLSGTFLNDAEMQTLVIYNTMALDKVTEDSNGFLTNSHKDSLDIAQHLPDITVSALLNALMRQFNLCIQITETDLKIDSKDSFLSQIEKENLTRFAERYPSVEPFKTNNNGFVFESQMDSNDALWKALEKITVRQGDIGVDYANKTNLPTSTVPNETHFLTSYQAWYRAASVGTFKLDYLRVDDMGYAPQYTVGQGKETIQTDIGTLIMRKHMVGEPVESAGHIPEILHTPLLPAARQKGNSPEENFQLGTTNDYTLRLLFYRGLQRNYDDAPYPLASNDTHSAIQVAITQRSLLWDKVYHQHYKNWLNATGNGKALNLQLYLDAARLSNFDMTAKYRISNQTLLPEKLSVAWTDSGTKKANLRALKF